MKSALQVATPPAKPLMIFDGDCTFCRRWIGRWQHTTGERVDYLPFQDPGMIARFPELREAPFQKAVHLVETDGAVYFGAEAAIRALAHNPREQWLLDWYEHSPLFTHGSEWGYRLVARHRGLFSFLTRLGWGNQLEPSTYQLVRWVFLRSLGLIYLAAFVSLWLQLSGLVGQRGIMPATILMQSVRQQMTAEKIGWERYHLLPTLCWASVTDGFLNAHCAAGTILSVLLIAGVAPAPCLFLLWLIYLSLTTVCGLFLGFQWDNLLLETGFLAIFFAPLQFLPRVVRAPPPSRLALWLLRWLLFRLMVESGWVKLLSGDVTWRNLTALSYHFENQPLPTCVGWYAHQLPLTVQKVTTALMFSIELVVPFLIFAPRRLRHLGCATLVALQVVIFLTGNYCFFNLLTIALCLLLLDDAALQRRLPSRWRTKLGLAKDEAEASVRVQVSAETNGTGAPEPRSAPVQSRSAKLRQWHWPKPITIPLACMILATSLMQFSSMAGLRWQWPAFMRSLYRAVAPLRTFNSYGLFAVMTTNRLEIVIEGSNDGEHWLEYGFKYKPGDLQRRPGFVAPHQPRLDWQMWFAALGNYRQNPWLINFCFRLLQGSPEVLGLLERNPYPQAPPRLVRAVVYEYHFTDVATRRKTGNWWRSELKGNYMPVLSLRQMKE